MARHTPESKTAATLIGSLGYISFNPRVFAVMMEMAPADIQARFLELFLAYIDILSMKYDEKLYSSSEKVICERAKKVQESIGFLR